MSGLIKDKALGLIETVGLVGAIEACDAAAKAADVVISAAEVTDAALVTLKIFGELGAVQSAVEAGGMAASRVGQLLAAHVIANPDRNLDVIMGSSFELPHRLRTRKPMPSAAAPQKRSLASEMAEMEKMPVAQLRRFARTIPNLRIKGREISRADKETLLKEIRSALRRDE